MLSRTNLRDVRWGLKPPIQVNKNGWVYAAGAVRESEFDLWYSLVIHFFDQENYRQAERKKEKKERER